MRAKDENPCKLVHPQKKTLTVNESSCWDEEKPAKEDYHKECCPPIIHKAKAMRMPSSRVLRLLMALVVAITVALAVFYPDHEPFHPVVGAGSTDVASSSKKNASTSSSASSDLEIARTKEKNSTTGSFQTTSKPSSCVWTPDANGVTNCLASIHSLICPRRDPHKLPRFLQVGDSTMHHLSKEGKLDKLYRHNAKYKLVKTDKFACDYHIARTRCSMGEAFGIPTRQDGTWHPPGTVDVHSLEGPVSFGLKQPYCQDCRGCGSNVVTCEPLPGADPLPLSEMGQDEQIKFIHGGYIGIEFARDVVLQNDRFATTQENVANYLQEEFNADNMLHTWEKPTCLINTGHHDVVIDGMTQDRYLENVRWYLHLMSEQCQNILWLATTAPMTENFAQKMNQTEAWGHAVRDMLQSDPILKEKSFYIDVFDASKTFEHRDNVHMAGEWYLKVSQMFRPENLYDCEADDWGT